MGWEGAIENGPFHPLGLLFSLSRVVKGVDNRTEANLEKLLVSVSGTHLLNLTTKPEFGNMLLSLLPFALNLLMRSKFFMRLQLQSFLKLNTSWVSVLKSFSFYALSLLSSFSMW